MSITEEIFKKLSAGRAPGADDFHAGKMYLLLQDPFGLWCNYHVAREEAVEEPNLYENLRGRTDRTNRDAWIHEYCKTTVIIRGEDETERFKNTLEAMAQGIDGIIGACLWDLRGQGGHLGQQGVWGTVNLLFKVNSGVSLFGDYHYKIVQLKRANDLKEHYALQTALMDMILTEVQSAQAENALFVLKSKEQTLDTLRLKDRALGCVAHWAAIKSGILIPEPHKPPKAAQAPWRCYANKYVFDHKDLILLPHLSAAQRELLRDGDIENYEDVLAAGLPKIKEILADPDNPAHAEETAVGIYATSAAYRAQKPVVRSKDLWPPPHKKRNLYFDFEATETFTKDSISFVYLIGLWDKEGGKFVSFIAKNEGEEEKIFKEFADYIGDGQDVNLYHWTEYEVKKMFKLCEKYPAIKDDLHKLMDACVDLKIVVEKSFYLPAPSLSLKAAAPAFGFSWRQTDCGAMDSMVYFTKWLAGGPQELMDKVLKYNEDDCRAMLFIEDYLNTHEALELNL